MHLLVTVVVIVGFQEYLDKEHPASNMQPEIWLSASGQLPSPRQTSTAWF